MEFNNNLPIYLQIMDLIKSQVSKGELSIGEKLPSVRELSKDLKVNPNTIQRVYQELEREEIIYTQRGMGSFITEDVELIKNLKSESVMSLIENFVGEMHNLGYSDREVIEKVKEFINSKGVA